MGIALNYENSKVVNFIFLRNMILEDDTPFNVHNPRKIKRKHGCVGVSEPEKKEYKIFLRSGGLWTTLIPFHMVKTNQFILYLYLFIFIDIII